jgi:hypothetical protein
MRSDAQKKINEKSLKDLSFSISTMFFLVLFIFVFMMPLQDEVANFVKVTTNLCLIICLIMSFAYLAFYIHHLTGENSDIYFSYMNLKILFNLSVSIFFIAILIWVGYLRGVLNSPFSALLCTTPITLVLIAVNIKNVNLNHIETTTSSSLIILLHKVEFISGFLPIIIFLISAVLIELWLSSLFGYYEFFPALKNWVIEIEKHSKLKDDSWYKSLSYIAFYGSIISTLVTYYTTKKITK